MAERVVISVDPGLTEQSSKVQDVFGHVLDLFDLLGHSGEETDAAIAWKLVSVSMNSPLTIVAEAIAVRPAPNFSIDQLARCDVSIGCSPEWVWETGVTTLQSHRGIPPDEQP